MCAGVVSMVLIDSRPSCVIGAGNLEPEESSVLVSDMCLSLAQE